MSHELTVTDLLEMEVGMDRDKEKVTLENILNDGDTHRENYKDPVYIRHDKIRRGSSSWQMAVALLENIEKAGYVIVKKG